MDFDGPVLDDHLHLDPAHGKGIEAVREFARVGGTHLLVVNKPSWHLGVEADTGGEFAAGFETTIETVERASDVLDGRAWPVLGVHPGLITRLVEERGFSPEAARDLMCAGLDCAAEYVADGRALALKSGRPHYEVSSEIWDASNAVLDHALALGADHGCAVQLHTESTTDLSEAADRARERGLSPEKVVKHYADGRLAGPTPSVICEKDSLEVAAERAVEADAPFLMETDFIDDPDRPGAVMGPKTVPRRVRWLREAGYDAAMECAHVETPRRVYGIDTRATLDAD